MYTGIYILKQRNLMYIKVRGSNMRQFTNASFITVSTVVHLLMLRGRPISASTVRLWADTGKLPSTRTGTGTRLFRRSDVEAIAEQTEHEAVAV